MTDLTVTLSEHQHYWALKASLFVKVKPNAGLELLEVRTLLDNGLHIASSNNLM